MTDAQSMANRGLIDAKDLEPARDIQGYQALLRSTFIVVSLLREKWAQIQGSSPLTLEDIERTRQDAEKMQIALALRDGGANQAPAAELRMRAFSLLIRHYDQVRRAVSYLRWNEDDADTIAPSFWAGRGRKPRTETPLVEPSTPEPATPEAPVDPANPGAGPLDPTAPGGPFTS